MLAVDWDLCERDTLIYMQAKQTKSFRLRTVIFSLLHLGIIPLSNATGRRKGVAWTKKMIPLSIDRHRCMTVSMYKKKENWPLIVFGELIFPGEGLAAGLLGGPAGENALHLGGGAHQRLTLPLLKGRLLLRVGGRVGFIIGTARLQHHQDEFS